MENVNSTFGPRKPNDHGSRSGFAPRDKRFPVRNLAGIHFGGLSFGLSSEFEGQVHFCWLPVVIENLERTESVNDGAFYDSAQINVFVRTMRNRETAGAIRVTGNPFSSVKASFQESGA